jgi:hypothetical protein
MPTDKPTEKLPAKTARLARHESAVKTAEEANANLRALEEQFLAAKAKSLVATEEAEAAYQDAYAEEITEAARTAKENEDRHHEEHGKHCKSIEERKAARVARGEAACAHDAIKVITIDGFTHPVVSAHGLFLGTHGFKQPRGAIDKLNPATEPRAGSRYKVACGYSVDAAHDELDHERFDQTKKPDCTACADAIGAMDQKVIPDTRGDYLSAKEQIAHARAENARRNKESSLRAEGAAEPPRAIVVPKGDEVSGL